jgi:hypothetical protein
LMTPLTQQQQQQQQQQQRRLHELYQVCTSLLHHSR